MLPSSFSFELPTDGLLEAEKLKCPRHPSAELIEDCRAGDVICPMCGLVVGDRVIDVSAEWRLNEKTDGFTPERNLSGNWMSPSLVQRDRLSNGQRTQRQENSDRNFRVTCKEIANIATRLNLGTVLVHTASNIYKKVCGPHLSPRHVCKARAAACLYIACRQEGVPQTIREICSVCTVRKKEIGRCFKVMLKILEIRVDMITPGDFTTRFSSKLGLPKDVQQLATTIAKNTADKNIMMGQSPISIAAGAIYIACLVSLNERTQREISEIACVPESTIRNTLKAMLPHTDEILPRSKAVSPVLLAMLEM